MRASSRCSIADCVLRRAQYLQNKRRGIVDELFKLLNVYIPDDATPMVPDPNNQYILCVDRTFRTLEFLTPRLARRTSFSCACR